RAMLRRRPDDVLQRQDEGAHPEEDGRGGRRRGGLPPHGVSEMPNALRMSAPREQMEARRGAVPVQGHGHHAVPGGAAAGRMVDRKFALPEYTYTSRKAVIIDDNCVGCEKCAIVCPVDAITMVTKYGFEVKDGRVLSTTAPPPPARPVAAAAKPAASPAPGSAPAPSPAPAPEEPEEP